MPDAPKPEPNSESAPNTPFDLDPHENSPTHLLAESPPQGAAVSDTDPLTTSIPPVDSISLTTAAGTNWPLRSLWSVIFIAICFYVFLLPEIQIAWWKSQHPQRMLPAFLQHDILTRSILRLLESLVVAFFFAVGASFGSFLNVVAYRLPKKLDISVAGSRCPNCGKRITFLENMPLFGWISLRGKCGGCHIPIPFKYLAAELLLGGLAVWIGVHELLSGGINLPLRVPNFYAGVVWIIFYTKWDLVSYSLFHFTLLCILSTQILILDNGLAVPRRFIVFCSLLGIVLSLSFPWLMLVHSSLLLPGIELREPGQLEGVRLEWQQSTRASVLVGYIYSAMIAFPAAILASFVSRDGKNFHFLMWLGTFTYIGLWLGWQASLCIALATLLMSLPLAAIQLSPYRKAFYLSICVLSVTVLHHALWAIIVNWLLKQFSSSSAE